jgi:hypothetical protein
VENGLGLEFAQNFMGIRSGGKRAKRPKSQKKEKEKRKRKKKKRKGHAASVHGAWRGRVGGHARHGAVRDAQRGPGVQPRDHARVGRPRVGPVGPFSAISAVGLVGLAEASGHSGPSRHSRHSHHSRPIRRATPRRRDAAGARGAARDARCEGARARAVGSPSGANVGAVPDPSAVPGPSAVRAARAVPHARAVRAVPGACCVRARPDLAHVRAALRERRDAPRVYNHARAAALSAFGPLGPLTKRAFGLRARALHAAPDEPRAQRADA